MAEVAQRNGSSETFHFGTPAAVSSLEGKGVLVIGDATGVGASAARALANAGAYVTIADDNAAEGQRLMLELINENKRVQYTYTSAPSFPSLATSFTHAASFPPTRHLSHVVANIIPPPSSSSSPPPPSSSLLTWLSNTPPSSPPAAPSTTAIDASVTAAVYIAHLAFHHCRSGGHLLFLAPRAHVEDGAVEPGALEAAAAAAGFKAVVRGLVGLGVEGVRVNLVAVGEGERDGRDEAGRAGVNGVGEAEGGSNGKRGRLAGGDRECTDAVMRIVRDETFDGQAVVVEQVGMREISI